MVIVGPACPSLAAMRTGSRPSAIRALACVCRRAWNFHRPFTASCQLLVTLLGTKLEAD